MKYNPQLKGMSIASLALLLATSCSKDAAYDDLMESDAIDLNMELGAGGLTLPFGSTEKIKLTELIDPDDSDIIETDAAGQYHLRKNGNLDPSDFSIDPVHVSAEPTITPISITLDAYEVDQEMLEMLMKLEALGYEVEGKRLSELNDIVAGNAELSSMLLPSTVKIQAKSDNISFDKETSFELKAENVDTQLLTLTGLTPNGDVDLCLDVKMNNLPGKADAYTLQFKYVVISLPSYVELYDKNGKRCEDPTHVPAELTFEKAVNQTSASSSLHYYIKGLDFGTEPLVNDGGTLYRPSEITILGNVYLSQFSAALTELKATKEEGVWKIQLLNEVDLAPAIAPVEIDIKTITGSFSPTIGDINTTMDIDLGEDVDFLKDQDVVIDIKNPEIKVDIDYNAPIRVLADIVLSTSQHSVTYRDIELEDTDHNGRQTVILTRKRAEKDGETAWYANDALSTLLSPVPEQIEVHIISHGDQTRDFTLELGKVYSFSGLYDVEVPFEFNSISFTYDEESEELFSEDDDLSKYLKHIDGVSIDLAVESTLPLDVTMDVLGRDRSGNVKSVLTSAKPVVKAGTLASPMTTDLSVSVDIDTETVRDLIYRFEAKGQGSFNANQYLQVKSSHINVKGQKVNLNDL